MLTKQVEDTDAIISAKLTEIESLQKKVDKLNDYTSVSNEEIKQAKAAVANLNADQLAAEKRTSELLDEENRVKTSISTLQDTFKYWQSQIDAKKADFKQQSEEIEESTKLLNAKLLKVTQELSERERAETSARSDLANMQRALDERDLNLRIREAKVEQGEAKIVQNANLLNM